MLESFGQSLSGLTPKTEAQRSEATAASAAAADLEKATWLEAAQESAHVQHPFVAMLILWLFVLFVSFGLFAPRNGVVVAALLVGALAIAGAVFLIVDMDNWRASFYKAATPTGGATPKNTLEAVAGIAREPWAAPKELFALFDQAYPEAKDGSPRAAHFVPYLELAPPDFALSLSFAGGGMFGSTRLEAFPAAILNPSELPEIDVPLMNRAAGLSPLPFLALASPPAAMRYRMLSLPTLLPRNSKRPSPSVLSLSPPINGFRGMGFDGVGWGTLVTADRVWTSGFNGKILVMDLNGRPVSDSVIPITKGLFGLMGVNVAENGDIWICDGPGNQMLYFPGGKVQDGKIVKVEGLDSPFDVIIDAQNRVWVSNSASNTLVRFPASDPSKVETFHAGLSVRALALDQKGNLWVTSNMSPDFPAPKMPPHATIMEQFKILAGAALRDPKPTGVVNMIRPDGTQVVPGGYTGNGTVDAPWGVNIDGNGDVWVGMIKNRSIVVLAGDDTKGHPAGTKAGDLIHQFTGGNIQMITDVNIDPAGDVWIANNWNSIDAATAESPVFATSTWGGGSGLTVIYGVASPVKPPRVALAKSY